MSDPLTLVITSMISSLFILNMSVLFCCTSACLFTVVSLCLSTGKAVKDETDKTDKIEPQISAGVGVTKAATSGRQRAVKAATLKGFRSVRSKRAVVEKGKRTHRLPSSFMIYEGVTLSSACLNPPWLLDLFTSIKSKDRNEQWLNSACQLNQYKCAITDVQKLVLLVFISDSPLLPICPPSFYCA